MAKNIYVDTSGRSHIVSKVLSSGGQGIVYMTEEPNILIKLEWNPITHKIERDISNNIKFNRIRILPLLEKTNLTLPQSVLKNVAGYTMKMLDGMVSFEEAFSGDGYELPENEWINSIKAAYDELGDKFQKYIATGGIRKRLKAFLNASCVLAKIHASGLVYCDISEKNMFVSRDPDKANVWLIDCDNLNYMSETLKRKDGGLHSPGYGAPEIYMGKGKTMYSDAFSFAIALFWELTMNHPFIGIAAQDAFRDMDIFDAPEEDYVCNGDFAWIGDEEDDSNVSNSGIPYDMFINKSLSYRFQKTFSILGRKNRQKRTTMPEWSYVLARELDHTVRCKYCNMDYYGNENPICPWCDTKNDLLIITSYRIIESEKIHYWDIVHEKTGNMLNLPLRLLEGFCSDHIDEKAFSITLNNEGIVIEDLSSQFDFFLKSQNKEEQFYGSININEKKQITIIAKNKSNNNCYLLEIEAR